MRENQIAFRSVSERLQAHFVARSAVFGFPEVGLGIVPDNPLGRGYRDLLGRVNTIWAGAAEHAFLVIAGRTLTLHPPHMLIEEVR